MRGRREEGWGREGGRDGRRVMEARESNEHIDLMRLIVMQLISAPAPVRKMKGLQLSEINWDLLSSPPPHNSFFFVSAPSVWTRIRRVWQPEDQRRFLLVSLHLSAFIPFPNTVITAASGTFTHEWPLPQLDSGGKCVGTWRSAWMCKGGRASLRITMYHDSHSSFSQLQAGQLWCQVTFRCINTCTRKKGNIQGNQVCRCVEKVLLWGVRLKCY